MQPNPYQTPDHSPAEETATSPAPMNAVKLLPRHRNVLLGSFAGAVVLSLAVNFGTEVLVALGDGAGALPTAGVIGLGAGIATAVSIWLGSRFWTQLTRLSKANFVDLAWSAVGGAVAFPAAAALALAVAHETTHNSASDWTVMGQVSFELFCMTLFFAGILGPMHLVLLFRVTQPTHHPDGGACWINQPERTGD